MSKSNLTAADYYHLLLETRKGEKAQSTLAKTYGCSTATIRALSRRFSGVVGDDLRPAVEAYVASISNRALTDEEKCKIIELCKTGMSKAMVAEETGCSYDSVLRVSKDFESRYLQVSKAKSSVKIDNLELARQYARGDFDAAELSRRMRGLPPSTESESSLYS